LIRVIMASFDEAAYRRLLDAACAAVAGIPQAARLPWESNSWLRATLGPGPQDPVSRPADGPLGPAPRLPENSAEALTAVAVASTSAAGSVRGPAYERAVRCLRDGEWLQLVEQRRATALAKWFLVVSLDVCSFAVGRELLAGSLSSADEGSLRGSLIDTFASKATGTLLARAAAMLRFADWCLRTGRRPFPVREPDAYDFVKYLQAQGKAPTAAANFLGALGFCGHVLGLDGALAAAASGRVRGASFAQAVLKRPLAQRPPLTVAMAAALEDAVFEEQSIFDRAAAGFFVFCYLARARFSDAQAVESLLPDFVGEGEAAWGYLEGKAKLVKTATTAAKKSQFLPMVAPVRGVANRAWAVEWLEVRAAAGLSTGPGRPLLPACRGGSWLRRPLAVGEASDYLRELLRRRLKTAEELQRVGTHSLKSTCLSWCAKHGVPVEVRRHLGYHASADELSTLVYSRDAAALPLRELERVLGDIRSGAFLPDVSRSGRFATAPAARPAGAVPARKGRSRSPTPSPAGPRQSSPAMSWTVASLAGRLTQTARVEVGEVDRASGPTSSSDSSGDESSGQANTSGSGSESGSSGRSAAERLARLPATVRGAAAGAGDLVWEHLQSGCLHVSRRGDEARLACGRPVTTAYGRASRTFEWPRCKQCFGTDP
jgi:hypothetical protein